MFEKSHHRRRAGLFTFIITIFSMLAQAGAAYTQTAISMTAYESSPRHSTDGPRLDASVPAEADAALRALADVAGTATPATGGLWLSGNTAGGLTYLGDKLGVELYFAAIVAFGVRIFDNIAVIRRFLDRQIVCAGAAGEPGLVRSE